MALLINELGEFLPPEDEHRPLKLKHTHDVRDEIKDVSGTWDREGVCAICGKTFRKKTKQQVCCSRECSKERHDRMRRKLRGML